MLFIKRQKGIERNINRVKGYTLGLVVFAMAVFYILQ
jgi:hypothetical protein